MIKFIGKTASGNYLIELSKQEWRDYLSRAKIQDNNIPATILKLRKTQEKTQEQMAKTLGISRNYYSQIERGIASNYSYKVHLAMIGELAKEDSDD